MSRIQPSELALAALLLSSASASGGNHESDRLSFRAALLEGPRLAQQCAQRVGPYATQSRAQQQWRLARSKGYAVSNGVTPCYDGGVRGYCFFVYSC